MLTSEKQLLNPEQQVCSKILIFAIILQVIKITSSNKEIIEILVSVLL